MNLNTEGSGLGLYISREIVTAHNGKIWVESKGRNKGSTFIVRLPIKT
ncbi:MAG: sensor histidine kinase [Promethearchaeota archaeon]